MKSHSAVEKQLIVDHAPPIAAFHLKRFKNNGSYIEKIDKHVSFPLELDLKPYTSGCQHENVDLNYNLYAIVEHAGFSPTSGHYFSFTRSASNTWFRLDDSQVSRVFKSRALSRDAYILFYAKNGTSWFLTFMETEKLHLDSIVSITSPKSVLETSNQSSEPSPTRESI